MKSYDDSKAEYERVLNDIDVPWDECKSNGGRIPDHCKYGTWVRKHDPIAFQVGYNEWAAELRFLATGHN